MKVPTKICFVEYDDEYNATNEEWEDNIINLTVGQIEAMDGIPSKEEKEVDVVLTANEFWDIYCARITNKNQT